MTVSLLVLSHGMQSGLAVCPLHLVEMHSICCRRFDVYVDKLLYVTPRFVYDFCFWKVDNESANCLLLELTFVRSGSFSLSKDFADTDIQIVIDALCTA